MATAGIDFGTTNSVVSLWTSTGPEVVQIDEPADQTWADLGFDRVMPTVFGLDRNKQTHFGWAAKLNKDLPSLEAVKRLMADADYVQVGDEDLVIEQVVAMFFRHIRAQVSLLAGEDIDRVVVTVPANSRGIARHRTRLCAQLAGLDVLTLINEPTAAAMAASQRMAHDGKILVVDWGGGTLDVTALETESGVFIEQASSGIPRLGGKDFDSKFSAAVLETVPEVQWTPTLRREFGLEIEKAKIRLSSQDYTNLLSPSGGTIRVTREMFDDVTRPLVERLRRPIEQVLHDARWDPSMVDHVLLVGGTCKIPSIRALVSEMLGRSPSAGVDPMTAISEGAAVAAAIMTGQLDNDFFVSTEHALGTIALDGGGAPRFAQIIGRGHKLPAVGRDGFSPVFEDQETVLIEVIEGDPSLPLTHDLNVALAEWEIELPPPDRGDGRSFSLEYRYDVEGILHVKATDDFTGDVMLEETVGSRASRDKRELVAIASTVRSTVETGTLESRPVPRSDDPETTQLVQAARNKVIPFIDDAEAAEIRALVGALESATDPSRIVAKDRLRSALNRYSYLL